MGAKIENSLSVSSNKANEKNKNHRKPCCVTPMAQTIDFECVYLMVVVTEALPRGSVFYFILFFLESGVYFLTALTVMQLEECGIKHTIG